MTMTGADQARYHYHHQRAGVNGRVYCEVPHATKEAAAAERDTCPRRGPWGWERLLTICDERYCPVGHPAGRHR